MLRVLKRDIAEDPVVLDQIRQGFSEIRKERAAFIDYVMKEKKVTSYVLMMQDPETPRSTARGWSKNGTANGSCTTRGY